MKYNVVMCVLAVSLIGLRELSFSAEIPVNADGLAPQVLALNRGDSIRWTKSPGPPDKLVESYTGEYKITLSANTGWSGSYRFQEVGTNYYQSGIRSGVVIVRDWTNSQPAITMNSPVDGMRFNYGPEVSREPILLMGTPTVEPKNVDRVEFLTGGVVIAAVTNEPYVIPRANLALGRHTLIARVVYRNGLFHESLPVHVSVEEISTPVLFVESIRDKNLILVSWLTPAINARFDMFRSENVLTILAFDTSSTSSQGVRVWVERVQPSLHVFYTIRQRF
jgi:hypothetical protein